jgi:deferrochelatase/peroxidase EfeB
MTKMNRRSFLIGATGLGAVALDGCAPKADEVTSQPASSRQPDATDSRPKRRQPGVTTPPPPRAEVLAALDISVAKGAGLARLLETINERVNALRHGIADIPESLKVSVTVAAGASLFDHRFGLARVRPARLTTMPTFPNDVLDPAHCHGDLLLQVGAERPDADRAALRHLLHGTGAVLRSRWEIAGFRPENHITPTGVATTRNLFGFREGIGNPNPNNEALMDELVWVQPDSHEPAWTAGGTYQVVRLIRFATELWDAEPVEHQEDVFGRHKQSGAPLAGSREDQPPNFAVDPDGRITPLDAHIRRANPRTPQTEANRILRRSYSYRRGRNAAGHPDEGLIFVCFQQDLERGFATVQRRLRGEALAKYLLPFGGGYYFVLPAAPPGGYLGQQLLEAAG